MREKLSNKRFVDWTENEQTAAAEALAAFDLAGAVTRLHETDSEILLDHWAHDLTAICRTCREYIAHRRAQEGHSYLQSLLWLELEANKSLAQEFTTPPLTLAQPLAA